jgi:glycosyltransferase involved in cell wall biosynthesis
MRSKKAVPPPRTFLFLSGHAHRALDPAGSLPSGGAELQVALLAKELVQRGERCVIASAGEDFEDGITWSGVRIRRAGRFDKSGLVDSLRAIKPVFRVLCQERPDFVVIYGWTSWLALMCLMRPFVRCRVVFVCALDSEINGGFRKANPVRGRLFDWGMKSADARFSITTAQAEAFRSKGMSCQVTRLLLQREAAPMQGEKTIDLLWVARCHPVKRPELFLELLENLEGVRARMICSPQDPVLHDSIRSRAQKIDGLEFLDGVPYREIQDHFHAARIFVNTSSDEGVPNTFLHSGLGGTAIASLVSDPDGLIEKFGAGFSAGGKPERLQRSVEELLKNPAALASAAAGARSFILAWHDNSKNVSAFLQGLPK